MVGLTSAGNGGAKSADTAAGASAAYAGRSAPSEVADGELLDDDLEQVVGGYSGFPEEGSRLSQAPLSGLLRLDRA